MIYHLILSPDAEDGFRSALLWYFQNDTNLPFRFETEFKFVLRRIAQNPNQFQGVSNLLRRALMKRFPYSIYFTVDGATIYVASVLRQRQLSPLNRP
jgi:plasmid stabilization system protein ParE